MVTNFTISNRITWKPRVGVLHFDCSILWCHVNTELRNIDLNFHLAKVVMWLYVSACAFVISNFQKYIHVQTILLFMCFYGFPILLLFAHGLGMPRTFSTPPWVRYPDIYHGTCVTHLPWCMSGSPTSGFLRRRGGGGGGSSRRSQCMRNSQINVSGKRRTWTSREE